MARTIDSSVESVLYKEKGSKFIGYVYPIDDEQGVKTILNSLKIKYKDATHICYAYRLGVNGEMYKINDDGEPSGSAGLPIYNQLLSFGVTHVILLVVRYFGGTKLGVSGLIKAYKQCAITTLNKASIIEIKKHINCFIKFSYSKEAIFISLSKKYKIDIIHKDYTDSCSFKLKIPVEVKDIFLKELTDKQLNIIYLDDF